jgi:saccharopine dehydrogenase-like NADP-dependent oxidoreductase
MQRAIVLGAGMVGSVMAVDLARDPGFEVTVADNREDALARVANAAASLRESPAGASSGLRAPSDIRTVRADLSSPEAIRALVAPYDLVLGALSSRLGFAALRAVIEAGKDYCDIAFMAEDALDLSPLAQKHGVTAIVDCGVAPGMSNLLAAYGASQLDDCRTISIYVGGLPRERRWPYQYKAAFAPSDVVEEYCRPTRLVENGKLVVREALSEPELLDFNGVGTLEAFNTDGLRSLVHTLKVPNMREKTMRYPGHIEIMRIFRDLGLFREDEVEVGGSPGKPGVKIRPRDLTAKLMFPKWTYEPGEEDLTVMRVICEGTRKGKETRLTWDLLDAYDTTTRSTSMARTTAFPCTIVARLLAGGTIKQPGVHAPEAIAQPAIVRRIMQELQARGVRYSEREETL